MLGWFVHRHDLVEMGPAVGAVADQRQGYSHDQVRDHARNSRAVRLGEIVKLPCKVVRDVAFERHAISDPETVEYGKQNQRIVDRLPGRLRFLDP